MTVPLKLFVGLLLVIKAIKKSPRFMHFVPTDTVADKYVLAACIAIAIGGLIFIAFRWI